MSVKNSKIKKKNSKKRVTVKKTKGKEQPYQQCY